jgi:hypothetical protein
VSVRGYPGQVVLATQAVKPALDLRVPISRIFRGHGTNRIFLDNFYGLAFAETSWVSGPAGGVVLPSAGLGLRLSTEFFYLPVTLSTEYHYGFNLLTGGGSDLFFQFLVSGMSF